MKGSITRRGDSWRLKYDIGPDPVTGKRRQRYKTVRGTKGGAQRELRRILGELDEGRYVELTKETVADWLRRWLDDYAALNVGGKTLERYREIVECHLIPALGDAQLGKLTPAMIAQAQSSALKNGHRQREGGLSPQTVRHHHRVLNQALRYAVKLQAIARNPAEAVDPPKVPHHEMESLAQDELGQLLKHLEGKRMHMPVLLAATTGMRRGEVLALHWRDLDLEAERLTVRRTIEQTKCGLRFKEPKTRGSRRTITLPSITIEALSRHKAQQAEERMQLGLGKSDLVFTRWDGEPVNPRNFTKEFSRCVRDVGIGPIGFHGLRHTHLSHLMASGVPVKAVAERAGHASAKMTLDVYGHVLPGMQEDVARQVDADLRGVLKG